MVWGLIHTVHSTRTKGTLFTRGIFVLAVNFLFGQVIVDSTITKKNNRTVGSLLHPYDGVVFSCI